MINNVILQNLDEVIIKAQIAKEYTGKSIIYLNNDNLSALEAIKYKLTAIKPKNPISDYEDYMTFIDWCPDCGENINSNQSFCSNCGQSLDWSDVAIDWK